MEARRPKPGSPTKREQEVGIILTPQGEKKVRDFIAGCESELKELLAGGATAYEVCVPTLADILSDIETFEDEDGEYANAWGITDEISSSVLSLTRDEDFI